jgi:hypothetical protein
LENYGERLARVVQTTWSAPQLPPIDSGLRLSQIPLAPLTVAKSSVDLLEFLSLSGCPLQVNIGRRNSHLGRHASASQLLLLDLEFLDLAPACIDYLDTKGDAELAESLRSVSARKREQLPQRLYNALLGGTEWTAFWQVPNTLGDYPEQTSGVIIDALTTLNALVAQWLKGDFRADNREVETLLFHIRTGDGGALLQAAHMQGQHLAHINRMLHDLETPLCPFGQPTERSRRAETVVSKFFAGDVQRWSAQVNQRFHDILPLVEALEAQLAPVLPPRYQQWATERSAFFNDHFRQAPKEHVALLKTLTGACGTTLGQQPSVPGH